MASGVAKSVPQPPPVAPPAPRGSPEDFIEKRIRATRAQVKLVDLVSTLMLLATGVLAYLLLVTLIDHWVWGLGFWGRLSALLVLLGGAGYYFAVAVVPLLLHKINPLYAARSIEQGTPSLKNSLINFLMFRSQRTDLHEAVYQALQQRAATDLAHVPSETAVDRSKLIKVGYVLAAILAGCALYLVLSPKDPLQTVARIVAPWKEIARPSRVEIVEVEPGDADAFAGQTITISARVRGIADRDPVNLVFSTADGQIVDRPVPMQLARDGLSYEGALPESGAGLQQGVEYRIEAGDAASRKYRITVSPAPTILVDEVLYEFPAYTKRPPKTVLRQGNLRAVEGTRVTVRAAANKEIRSAHVEFDPGTQGNGSAAARPQRRLPMEFEDRSAWRSWLLKRNEQRTAPEHASYQLGFVTSQGHASQQPILHTIEVVPDLPPEVEILTPRKDRVEVPENGSQRIEIRAVDPDYGLSRITLRAVAGGTNVVDAALFDEPDGRGGQTVVNYDFVPAQLGLAAGDKVEYWAAVEDNRTAAGSDVPEPNRERTRNFQFVIVPAKAGPGGSPPQPQAGEPREQPEQPDERPEESPQAGDKPGGADDAAEPEQGEPSGDQEPGQQTEPGEDPGAEPQPGEGASGEQPGQTAAGESSSGQPGGGTPQDDAQGAASEGGGGEGQPRQEPLHDGEVFERTLERIREQQQPTDGGQATGQDPPDAEGAADQGQRGQPPQQPGGANTGETQGPAQGESPATTPADKREMADQPPQQTPTEEGQPGEGATKPDFNEGAGAQRPGTPGEGGSSTDKLGAEPNREKPPVPGEQDQRPKEPGAGDNGDSGAGQNSQDTTGSGSVDDVNDDPIDNRDRRKVLQPDSSEPQPESDPGANTSQRQSDTEGGESGDKSGGGKKGPGQGANQAGNDSAGQNSAADDGAGAAQEAGSGEASDAPGQKEPADGQTGSTGAQKGNGSGKQETPQGTQTGGAGSPDGQPEPRPDAPPSDDGGGSQTGSGGLPTGGGMPSDGTQTPRPEQPFEVPDNDKVNLDYARRATDMVIDHLRDQQRDPDEELLRELNWSREDLQDFLDRWQRLKQAAAEDAQGQRELDETLRSLGLRPQRDRVRGGGRRGDDLKGLREAGLESQPPADYRELFDAFKKGTSRVDNP